MNAFTSHTQYHFRVVKLQFNRSMQIAHVDLTTRDSYTIFSKEKCTHTRYMVYLNTRDESYFPVTFQVLRNDTLNC